jgi:hypothetical protein
LAFIFLVLISRVEIFARRYLLTPAGLLIPFHGTRSLLPFTTIMDLPLFDAMTYVAHLAVISFIYIKVLIPIALLALLACMYNSR